MGFPKVGVGDEWIYKKTTKHFEHVFFVVLYKLNIFCHCMCSMVVQSGVQLRNDVISSDPIILFCKCILIFPHLYMTDIIPSHHSHSLQILYFLNLEG